MSHENIMRLWNDCSTGGRVRPKLQTVVKTSSYTLTSADFGKVFTTRGAATTVIFTLPAASSVNNGEWVVFVNVADQHMTVAGPSNGLVVFNDLTADNIGYGTANELIAGTFLALSDGTSWIVLPIATETQTIAVDTSPSSSPSSSVSSSPSTSPSTSVSSTPSTSVSNTPSTSVSNTPSTSVSNTPSTSPSST